MSYFVINALKVNHMLQKAERWRTDAFKLVLEKTLQSPLDSKEIKPSILKEINPEYSLEGLMLKLKLQYFGHLMWRTDSLEKTLMLGKIEGKRRKGGRAWDGWMPSPTQWTWVWANSGRWWRTRKPSVLQSMGSQRVGHGLVTKYTTQCTFMKSHACRASRI